MKNLLIALNKIHPMTEIEISQVSTYLSGKNLLKDDFLLKEGQICNFVAFVNKGTFRSFYTNQNGESINLMLNSENEFISDLESFITQKASTLNIQSIGVSEIYIIHKADLEKLYKDSLYWNVFGRLMTEHTFIIAKKRLEELLYQTPENRYLGIITKDPAFIDRYSLNDIASFLGIAPQSLSRIRARISKNRT